MDVFQVSAIMSRTRKKNYTGSLSSGGPMTRPRFSPGCREVPGEVLTFYASFPASRADTQLAARTPALAKLTRPRIYDALARPRLFALLDEAAARPIVWLSAPPGSGKSTLIASYLEERG